MILADESGKKFPWATFEPVLNNFDSYSLKDQAEASFNQRSDKAAKASTTEPIKKSKKTIVKQTIKESQINNSNDMLNMIASNMTSFNPQLGISYVAYPDTNFLFLVIGSNESKFTYMFMQGLAEFWKKFHEKYKFQVVYLSKENEIDKSICSIAYGLEWFFFKGDKNSKVKFNTKYLIKIIKLKIN